MIKYLFRHNKDYSRFNIIKQLASDIKTKKDVYILLPFSKNQFLKNFFKKDRIINDFFISNYDTYVYDRQKITKKNPRAWWKYFQDWFNFRFSKYLLSDTKAHFEYWEELFGKFKGKHLVVPVLADKTIYFPNEQKLNNKKIKILFYGSFIPLHGIDVILKALKILEEQEVEFEANIIGTGQNYSQMKELYESLNLQQVAMNGKVIQEKELAQQIREHDIILGIFGESKKAKSVIPNKVYQAFASKKAIVTMKSDTILEFFSESDLIMCDNTPKSLAQSLVNLYKDKNLQQKIAQNGYQKFNLLYDQTQNNLKEFIDEYIDY